MSGYTSTWVQCDNPGCLKWRRISRASAEALGERSWYCDMNPDVTYASCDAPQEKTDKEVELDEDGNEAAPEEEEEDYAPSLPLHEETWDGPFEPAARFAGARKGFVFKNGPLGVGYYGDDGGRSKRAAAASSAKASGAGAGTTDAAPPKRRPAVWQLVTENVYIHRHAKQLHEDDIMLCACAPLPPQSSSAVSSSSAAAAAVAVGGCGEACINRTLNLECVSGHCPSCTRDDEDCGNQRFARKQGAELESKRAGPKGFGLFSKVDLAKGQFIIEYVGEVLEEEEYARRKNFYAEVGQRHYYFMHLGNGEVIDACRKGALGRFVNHSCEPNCETQKWLVRGELAIGLFALRDIRAGEELTFDYNFDRYGDKPMRCLCATPSCCGYIGGGGIDGEDADKPPAEEEFSDADEALDATHDPEPIMVDAGHGTGSSRGVDPALLSVMEAQVGLAPGETPLGSRKKKAAPEKPKGADSDDEDFDEDRELGKKKKKEPVGDEKKRGAGGGRRNGTEEDDFDSDDDSGDEGGNRKPGRRRIGGGAGGGGGGRRSRFGGGGGGGGGGRRRPRASASIRQQQEASVVRFHKRRSEVDRRLDALLAPSGRLRDASVSGVVSLLRLFNLCDVAQDAGGGGGALATDGGPASPPPALLDPALPPSVAALAALEAPANAAGRRRARLADLSLLLDVVLKTQNPQARRELARCGALRQLQAVALRCSPLEDAAAPVLRKALRAAEALPLDAAAIHARNSAQGSFGDALVSLVRAHGDAGVRARAQALLGRWPPPRGSAAAAALAAGPVPGSRAAAAAAGGAAPSAAAAAAPPGGLPRRRSGHDPAHAARSGDDDEGGEGARERKRERRHFGDRGGDRGGGYRRPPSPSARPDCDTGGPTAEMPPGIGTRAGSQPAANAPPPPPLLLELGAAHLQQQQQEAAAAQAAAAAAAARHHHQQQEQRDRSASPPPPPPDSPPPDNDDDDEVDEAAKKGNNGSGSAAAARPGGGGGGGGWGASSGWGAAGAAANPPPPLPKADSLRPSSNPNFPPDAWPHPSVDFEAHVRRLVRALCDKYSRPEHPLAVPAEDAAALAERAAATIIDSEKTAAAARAREGASKPIDRRKLEGKAAEFVRVSVIRFHEKKAGLM